jgi:Flp pilus assembly CpaF family ATPase
MDKHSYDSAILQLKNALQSVALFMDDPKVQEIEINGPDDVWVETSGVQARAEVSITDEQIRRAIQILARMSHKDAKGGTKEGIIDARMDGFRVAAALPPTSVRGPSICIRKHNPVLLTLDDYVAGGSFTDVWAGYMRKIIGEHKNILVCGGTSSGKTTFVNALINEISPDERILTIEDTPELKVSSPNWVSLESNEQADISTRDLVRLALRYRPDRIIVGEVRGGEAYDLLDAANTGHDGCIATIHANSSFDALSRFETLILRGGVNWPHDAICTQIARTFDCVIFMARRNGLRQLCEILELTDFDTETKKYQYEIVFKSSKASS